MLSITLQFNLHIVVHACKHCIRDAFQSHNQNKGHVFEDDENKATIVSQSKQSVKAPLFLCGWVVLGSRCGVGGAVVGYGVVWGGVVYGCL